MQDKINMYDIFGHGNSNVKRKIFIDKKYKLTQ